eukprot:77916-Amphidinium_carterae.1
MIILIVTALPYGVTSEAWSAVKSHSTLGASAKKARHFAAQRPGLPTLQNMGDRTTPRKERLFVG